MPAGTRHYRGKMGGKTKARKLSEPDPRNAPLDIVVEKFEPCRHASKEERSEVWNDAAWSEKDRENMRILSEAFGARLIEKVK